MMLEENQKILLTGMSELVFYLKRDMEELKSINESLKKKIAIKDDVMKFQLEQIEKITLEKNELNKKFNEVPDDYPKLREELKQKDNLIKLYEEQLKKYRKEEKKREEISKVLGETIKEMKTKEWKERILER